MKRRLRGGTSSVRWRLLIGCAVGALACWLLFRDTDWTAVLGAIRSSRPWWLLLSVTLATASHLARVQRWRYAIRVSGPAPFRIVFAAAQIGFLMNVLLPLRLGEAARAVALARLLGVRAAQAAALVAVDRMADMLALVPILFVTVLVFPTHQALPLSLGGDAGAGPATFTLDTVLGFGASLLVLIGALGALLLLAYRRPGALAALVDAVVPRRWPGFAARLRAAVPGFSDGVRVFRSVGDMGAAMAFSLAAWALGILSLTSILVAFEIAHPWYAPFLMLTLIVVFVTLPVAPGLVGQHHAAVVAALVLTVPATPTPVVAAVALTTHLIAVSVVAALGVLAMGIERDTATWVLRAGDDA